MYSTELNPCALRGRVTRVMASQYGVLFFIHINAKKKDRRFASQDFISPGFISGEKGRKEFLTLRMFLRGSACP